MYCKKCGHELDNGYEYCKNCGAKINENNTNSVFAANTVQGSDIIRIGLYGFNWIMVLTVAILLVFCPMVKVKQNKQMYKTLVDKYGPSAVNMDLSEYSLTEMSVVKDTFLIVSDIISEVDKTNSYSEKEEVIVGIALIICVTVILVIAAVVAAAFAIQSIKSLVRNDRVMIVNKCRGFAVLSIVLLAATIIWTIIYNWSIAGSKGVGNTEFTCSAGLYIIIVILAVYASVGLSKYNDFQFKYEQKKSWNR